MQEMEHAKMMKSNATEEETNETPIKENNWTIEQILKEVRII